MLRWCRFSKRESRVKIVLRLRDRKFVLSLPRDHDQLPGYNGRLSVKPPLRGTRASSTPGRLLRAEAYVEFVVHKRTDSIKFQGIGVPDEFQRNGWASDMVRALLAHYPDVWFFNSSVNEKSGPLFIKLQGEFPERIAPLRQHADGGYEVLWWKRPATDQGDAGMTRPATPMRPGHSDIWFH